MTTTLAIPGFGIDADESARPGVPQELDPPEPLGNAHWLEPDAQPYTAAQGKILISPGRRLTKVFSSAHPPRGLSGRLRRIAYKIPEYRARRWLLLLLADRIDVVEHNRLSVAKLLRGTSLGLLAVDALSLRALRRRS